MSPDHHRRCATVARFPAPFLACVALALAACGDATGPDGGDLLDRLNALPGVTAVEIVPHYGYPRQFVLDITQPVSHDNPSGPTFTQRAWLSHADVGAPMVFGAYVTGPTRSRGRSSPESSRRTASTSATATSPAPARSPRTGGTSTSARPPPTTTASSRCSRRSTWGRG